MSSEHRNSQTAAPELGRPRFGRIDADMADVESAISRSRDYVLSRQDPEGYWNGELEADVMLEADYIFPAYAA